MKRCRKAVLPAEPSCHREQVRNPHSPRRVLAPSESVVLGPACVVSPGLSCVDAPPCLISIVRRPAARREAAGGEPGV